MITGSPKITEENVVMQERNDLMSHDNSPLTDTNC